MEAFLISTGLLTRGGASPGLSLIGSVVLASVQFGISIALQLIVMAVCLVAAVQRVEGLGD